MFAAEVVQRCVRGEHGDVVLNLLAKGVRQPRKAAVLYWFRQVVPFAFAFGRREALERSPVHCEFLTAVHGSRPHRWRNALNGWRGVLERRCRLRPQESQVRERLTPSPDPPQTEQAQRSHRTVTAAAHRTQRDSMKKVLHGRRSCVEREVVPSRVSLHPLLK
jgi:hypothetical protein